MLIKVVYYFLSFLNIMNKNKSGKRWLNFLSDIPAFFRAEPKSRSQLTEMLRRCVSKNLLDYDTLTMVEAALKMHEIKVKDIMIPRVQMVVVEDNAVPEAIIQILVKSGHSRFPVIGKDPNEIIGILLAKDLLNYFSSTERGAEFNIKDITRQAFYVPESKRLNILLRQFRSNRNHMAIVVDEYSSVSGLVTMEDIIEEIVGEIEDEHDIESEDYIKAHRFNRYTVSALTPLNEFNDFFDLQFSDIECDTVGGLVVKQFDYVPKRGESIKFLGLTIKILRADKRRVHLVSVTPSEQRLPASDNMPTEEE